MAAITGQWGTLTFGIPDFLEGVRDSVNDFAELLITYLEVANLALEFVKAFVKGFLDPIAAIIEAILAEVLAFLRDLKQIGLYITGDWALLGWPPEDLRGGYQGFERRMIARLTDRTDPTRPDVSSATKVFGLFTYLSVDPSDFERLIAFIISMLKLFGLSFFPDTSSLPVPVIRDTQYGAAAIGGALQSFQFSTLGSALKSWDGTPPQQCRVTWVARSASQKHPLNPFPVLGPSGYLVTVSTVPDGITLRYARVRGNNADRKDAGGVPGKQVQPREYGTVIDMNSQPIKLYGGAEMLDFKDSPFEYNAGMNPSTQAPSDGACQVFGVLDPASNEVIPLETLGPSTVSLGTPGDGKGDQFFLQRTFLITDGVTLAQWFAGEYSTVLDYKDMPHHARWEKDSDGKFNLVDLGRATTYYVRVLAVGKQVAEGKAVPQWDFDSDVFKTNVFKSGEPFVVDLKSGSASISYPSPARKITFVGANTQEYLHALQTALLVLVLTRADMPLLDELLAVKGEETADKYRSGAFAGQGFALNRTGLEDARRLLTRIYADPTCLEAADQNPVAWREDLFTRIRGLAYAIYEKTGTNPKLEKYVVDSTEDLRTVRVSETLTSLTGSASQAEAWSQHLTLNGLEDPLLLEAFDPDHPASRSVDFGFAPNMNSTGISPTDVDDLFFIEGVLQGREEDFVVFRGGEKLTVTFSESDPGKVFRLIQDAPDSLRRIYEKFTQADGSLFIPDEYRAWLTARLAGTRIASSGDSTPVFVSDQDQLASLDRSTPSGARLPAMVFTRGMMRAAKSAGGVSPILAQAALVLKVAAAERAPADGEWIAIRLFDAWPDLEEFLRALENWVKTLAEAVKSVADTIVKYIEFVQAQIAELQQLIRRINALIQAFLGFTFSMPQCSGLLLVSDGTDGIMADLVAAENKPSDTPLSYGAGIAILAPFAPTFLLDVISLAMKEDGQPTQDLNQTTQVTRPPDAVGTEGAAPGAGPAPTTEPDVL